MKIRFTRSLALSAVAASTALGLAACGGGSSTASTGGSGSGSSSSKSGGTLTLGVITQATTFSAAGANWANESPYMQAVYDGLLKASTSNEIQPNLATAWAWNKDKTQLTLTLRSGVTFTDGTPFTADVAAQNLMRFKAGTSPNASFLANLKSAKAADPTHVVLTLSKPDPAMLEYLTQNAGLQESPKEFGAADEKTKPVGSGPYTLDTANTRPGSTYAFVKNPNYWNKADQHYDKLVINVYANGTALLNAIKGGQVNAANTFDNTTVNQIKASGWQIEPLELNWEGLILFDRAGTQSKPLANVKVRQALNYAFDRAGLLKATASGFGTVTEQIFPKTSQAYDPALDSTYSYDPAKAKSLLAEAGYPNGFTIKMPSTAAFQQTFDLVKQQLAAVGVTVQFDNVQGADFISGQLAKKWPATWMILQEDPTDWQLTSFQIAPTGTFNPFKSATPELNALITKLQTAPDAQSGAIAKQINQYIVQNAWFVPWFRPQSTFVSDSKTNVTVQPGNAYPYLWNITPKA